MDDEVKNGFEQIKVSDKLDDVVDRAIAKAKKDKKKNMIKTNIIKSSVAAASLLIVFITSIKFIPVFAQVLNNVTNGSSITHEAKSHYDKNIGLAETGGFVQNINESKTNKNIKVTINNVITDDKNVFIFYTLNGKLDKQGVKNLLLQNFKIYDDKYDLLLNSTSNYYSELPSILDGKEGDFLFTFNNKYRCVITSLGDSIKNYSQNYETYGTIELSALNENKIPDELNLKFLSFTEAYQMSYSKERYDNFISRFYRNPMSINGEWNFNMKINQNLKSIKPENYKNIEFSADHTDFNIKSFKIYPTRIEAKIEVGKNKLDGAKCYSIGQSNKNNNKNLPYLIDEKGNKYKLTDKEIENIDSDNSLSLTFQSCYFNYPEELYLVLNELNYKDESRNFSKDIGEVKIRIK